MSGAGNTDRKNRPNRARREAWLPILGILLMGFAIFEFVRSGGLREIPDDGNTLVPRIVAVIFIFTGGGMLRRYAKNRNEEKD